MKKILVSLVAVIICSFSSSAAVIDSVTAKRVAINFWHSSISHAPSHKTDIWQSVPSGYPNLYIFERNSGEGFVIVAGDSRVQPILAYSAENGFAYPIPPHISSWLSQYSREISKVVELDLPAGEQVDNEWARLAGETAPEPQYLRNIGPLVPTRWNQSPLYNNLCPYDSVSQSRCVTGCVATAMAQVMYYWQYPTTGTGSTSYTPSMHPEFGTIGLDFSLTTLEWDSMPLSLSSSSTPGEINAVATLMYNCGVAVHMDYGTNAEGGSGAPLTGNGNTGQGAMKNNFGYRSCINSINRSSYNDSVWTAILRVEIDEGRPILYRGSDSAAGGHAFICDGYDSRNRMHFNWGWGGSSDGFFVVNNLNAGSYNFNLSNAAVINIIPNGGLYVSPLQHNFTADSGYSEFYLRPTRDTSTWTVFDMPDWLSISTISDRGRNASVRDTILCQANPLTTPRSAHIGIGNRTDTIWMFITQQGTATCNLTVQSSTPTYGSVTGAGRYAAGTTTTISATANTGRRFISWHDGNTQNPRDITLHSDATYTAVFANTPNTYWKDVVTSQPAGYIVNDSVITISSAEGLAWLISCANGLNGQTATNFAGKIVNMTCNVDINANKWTPINNFAGTLCGNGHSIKGIFIDNATTTGVGFIKTLSGSIRNLGLEGGSVTGKNQVGAFAGTLSGGMIDSCFSTVPVESKANNSTDGICGGLVGLGTGGTIRNSYASTNVKSSSNTVGGLIGQSTSAIENCYFVGNVYSETGLCGGIAGKITNGTGHITNCYAAGCVNGLYSSGIVSYVDNAASMVSHCYARQNTGSFPICAAALDTSLAGNATFSGVDTAWYLNTSVLPDTGTATTSVFLDALNRWTSAAPDTYRRWRHDTRYINEGLPIFGIPNCITIHDTIVDTACDSYTWIDGHTYTTSTMAEYVDATQAGCDSIIHLVLTIKHGSTSASSVTSCIRYVWQENNNATYTQSGNYLRHYTAANGCPSTDTLHLTITYSSASYDTIEACESYTWVNGVTYRSNVDSITYEGLDPSGCYRTDTLRLTILHSTSGIDNQTACGSYTWLDGNTYTASTDTPTFVGTNAAGCDSVITLHLTIRRNPRRNEIRDACDYFIWNNGVRYTEPTDSATRTIAARHGGCDTIVTLHLTLRHSSYVEEYRTACDSYTWHNRRFYESTDTATFRQTNLEGCPHIVTLHLTLHRTSYSIETAEACERYAWKGRLYRQSTSVPRDTTTNIYGCDSIVNLHLTIHPSRTGSFTHSACDRYEWVDGRVYISSATATTTLRTVHGCDSVVTLRLTILRSTSSIDMRSGCDAFTWIDGRTYTESTNTPTYHRTNAVGCDSTIVLHLSLGHSDTTHLYVSDYSSYTWRGNTYTHGGDYAAYYTNSDGCDSVVLLHLTLVAGINNADNANIELYPNPTRNMVTVRTSSMLSELHLYDLRGREIYSARPQTAESAISTASLPAGTYILRIVTPENTSVSKLTKIQ